MPHVILCKPDDTLFNETKCCLLVRYQINHSSAIPRITYFFYLFKLKFDSPPYQTPCFKSKKKKNRMKIYALEQLRLRMLSVIDKTACSVECCERKPNYL